MKVGNNNIIQQNIGVSNTVNNKPAVNAPSFNRIFSDTITQKITTNNSSSLQFSKHAHMRLNARQISLSDEQLQRVEDGVTTAQTKGIRDSLVIVDDIALVVNTRSKVVVTALNKGQETENVFTNIDGAVIV